MIIIQFPSGTIELPDSKMDQIILEHITSLIRDYSDEFEYCYSCEKFILPENMSEEDELCSDCSIDAGGAGDEDDSSDDSA